MKNTTPPGTITPVKQSNYAPLPSFKDSPVPEGTPPPLIPPPVAPPSSSKVIPAKQSVKHATYAPLPNLHDLPPPAFEEPPPYGTIPII